MKISDLAERDGKAGKWSAETDVVDGRHRHFIYHYTTLMLSYWVEEAESVGRSRRWQWDGDVDDVYAGWGQGSVSDQGGMNKLFRKAGIPLYFTRAADAMGVWVTRPTETTPPQSVAPWLR